MKNFNRTLLPPLLGLIITYVCFDIVLSVRKWQYTKIDLNDLVPVLNPIFISAFILLAIVGILTQQFVIKKLRKKDNDLKLKVSRWTLLILFTIALTIGLLFAFWLHDNKMNPDFFGLILVFGLSTFLFMTSSYFITYWVDKKYGY